MKEAYAAGLFDGEGCIHVDNRGYLVTVIANNNLEVLEWVADKFGGRVYEVRPGHYQWRGNGPVAHQFLERIEDYLIVKREKARQVVSSFSFA